MTDLQKARAMVGRKVIFNSGEGMGKEGIVEQAIPPTRFGGIDLKIRLKNGQVFWQDAGDVVFENEEGLE